MFIPSTAEQPISFFTLPLEVRQIVYDHIFIGTLRDWQYNNQHAYKCHGLLCIFRDRSIAKALLLTNKRIKDEAIHHYYNTAIFRLRTGSYHPPLHTENDLCAQRKALGKFFLPFTDASITQWHIHLLFQWNTSPLRPRHRFLLHDAIIWMLSTNAPTIQTLIFRIPCLCSDLHDRYRNPAAAANNNNNNSWVQETGRYYPEKWTQVFPPVLERYARLRMGKAAVRFVTSRQETLPPCPLRRCKALAQQLKGLKDTIEGDESRSMEPPAKKRRVG